LGDFRVILLFFINKTGKTILDPKNECMRMFIEELAVVCTEDEVYSAQKPWRPV
jgi:hypothetical protein